ncbi:MAG: hypothetical protein H0T91_10105 [Propionibacteriaceae bacterium]|nr:hypothetical protein [Propionibacteriaceae bacterium]
MAEPIPKAARVLVGIMLMVAFVMIAWSIVARYAGGWGVPYFSFQTERGSTCRNDLTGYTCHQLSLADLEFYGEVDLPQNTRVIEGTYRSTHDYQLNAQLQVPKASAAAALKGLTESFGQCQPGHASPLPTTGLTQICVLANDDAVTRGGEVSSRLYVVGTGLRKDGVRLISLNIKSR